MITIYLAAFKEYFWNCIIRNTQTQNSKAMLVRVYEKGMTFLTAKFLQIITKDNEHLPEKEGSGKHFFHLLISKVISGEGL